MCLVISNVQTDSEFQVWEVFMLSWFSDEEVRAGCSRVLSSRNSLIQLWSLSLMYNGGRIRRLEEQPVTCVHRECVYCVPGTVPCAQGCMRLLTCSHCPKHDLIWWVRLTSTRITETKEWMNERGKEEHWLLKYLLPRSQVGTFEISPRRNLCWHRWDFTTNLLWLVSSASPMYLTLGMWSKGYKKDSRSQKIRLVVLLLWFTLSGESFC